MTFCTDSDGPPATPRDRNPDDYKRVGEIWNGEHDHRTPFPNDGGILNTLRLGILCPLLVVLGAAIYMGRLHPDKKVAKEARKAAFKARSQHGG